MASPLDLVKFQESLRSQVESALSNFKKDSDARKTLTYFETRIEKLHQCYRDFEKYHMQILQSNISVDHEYFKTDSANTFEELYVQARSEIVEAFRAKFPNS